MGRILNGSIAVEQFGCPMCYKPLRPPIFLYTTVANFICEACRDKLYVQDIECSACSNTLITRSFAMESVVESIRVDCAYAAHGCAAKTVYYDKEEHEKACPHGRCFCPEPGCGFAGRSPELWDHFASHHRWPSVTFGYFKRFDVLLRLGFHVLRGESDVQVFVLYVEPAGPHDGGHAAVSMACVRAGATESKYGCSLSFSCFKGHHGSSTLRSIPCSTLSDGPPTGFCLVPNASGEGDSGGVLLTVNIYTGMGCDDVEALEEDDDDEGSSHNDDDDA